MKIGNVWIGFWFDDPVIRYVNEPDWFALHLIFFGIEVWKKSKPSTNLKT